MKLTSISFANFFKISFRKEQHRHNALSNSLCLESFNWYCKEIKISWKYNYFPWKYISFDDSPEQKTNKTRNFSKNKAIYGTIDPGRRDSNCQSVDNVLAKDASHPRFCNLTT